jgi:hypothetical protein
LGDILQKGVKRRYADFFGDAPPGQRRDREDLSVGGRLYQITPPAAGIARGIPPLGLKIVAG